MTHPFFAPVLESPLNPAPAAQVSRSGGDARRAIPLSTSVTMESVHVERPRKRRRSSHADRGAPRAPSPR